MQVNFDAPLMDPKGNPFTDAATLSTAAYAAFQQPLPSDTGMQMEARLKQYRLMQKCGAGGMQECTAEEIAEIKDRVCKTMTLVVFGAVVEILESAKVSSLPKAVEQEQKAS